MADPFATIDDVEALFGTMDDQTTQLATRLLRMASNLIRARVITVDARIAAYSPGPPPRGLDPDVAADVTAAMVARVLRNPKGVTAESVGPASATFAPGTGQLTITPDEILMLAGPAPHPSIGTIRTRPGLAPKVRPFGRFGPTFDLPRRDW